MSNKDIAEKIASNLGDGWTFEEPSEGFFDAVFYICKEDKKLFLRFPSDPKGKLKIVGARSRYRDGGQVEIYENNIKLDHASINVCPSRSVESIVKDIERRLLPEYLKQHSLVLQRIEENAKSQDIKKNLYLEICSIFKEEPRFISDAPVVRYSANQYNDSASFQVHSGGTVYIELRTGGDKAKKIAEFIKKLY